MFADYEPDQEGGTGGKKEGMKYFSKVQHFECSKQTSLCSEIKHSVA